MTVDKALERALHLEAVSEPLFKRRESQQVTGSV